MKNIHNQQATPNATSKKCSIRDFGQGTNYSVDTAKPRKKTETKEQSEKRSG